MAGFLRNNFIKEVERNSKDVSFLIGPKCMNLGFLSHYCIVSTADDKPFQRYIFFPFLVTTLNPSRMLMIS